MGAHEIIYLVVACLVGVAFSSSAPVLSPTHVPFPTPSTPPTPSPTFLSQCMLASTSPTSVNYPYKGPGTGDLPRFTVPVDVPKGTIVRVRACGAQGGSTMGGGGGQGLGGFVQADFAVSAGDSLTVLVGQMGATAPIAGISNSAVGGGGTGSDMAGGGGGYSSVFSSQNYYLVIAGGGGGDAKTQGGGGGGSMARNGGTDSCGSSAGGGTQLKGGAASGCQLNNCVESFAGSSMQGGSSACISNTAGGGGGGYYGGASGGSDGGGGGGSSYIHPLNNTLLTNSLGVTQGDGFVSLELILGPSVAPTPAPISPSPSPTSPPPTKVPSPVPTTAYTSICKLSSTSPTAVNFPFSSNSSNNIFTVPSNFATGPITMTVRVCGAQGGISAAFPLSGLGGYVLAQFLVSSNDEFSVFVGGQGGADGTTGVGGGGSGIPGSGAGGGGLSSIFSPKLNKYLVIAGAGGGSSSFCAGGNGGGDVGVSGCDGGISPLGGSQTAGGAAGMCNFQYAYAGVALAGGNGDNIPPCSGGGGGGAGFYGGGGGLGESGAGGSSYINVNEASFSTLVLNNDQGVQVGDGFVSIELSVAPTPSPSRSPTPSPSTPPTPSPTFYSQCMLTTTSPTSVNYPYGASSPTFVVPAGIPKGTIVRVRACGAQGGSSLGYGGLGGFGGFVQADFAVLAGDSLTVLVGQKGGTAPVKGFNTSNSFSGNAVGGGGQGSVEGGGGGGYSSVSLQNYHLVIAGAGGGGAQTPGGGGGGSVALSGGAYNGCIAGGGSQTGGGAAADVTCGDNSCYPSISGSPMQGGSSICGTALVSAGGGGGGFFGGASGGNKMGSGATGGGGGSSYIHTSALNNTSLTNAQAVTQGDGYVSLELILGPTTAPTPAPTIAPSSFAPTPASQCKLSSTSPTAVNFPFSSNSSNNIFTVPSNFATGPITMTVSVCGAQGGFNGGDCRAGLGGYVQAQFLVYSNDEFSVSVGGQGGGDEAPGIGGGGSGSEGASGGGGLSSVFSPKLGQYLAIAGAGGGNTGYCGGDGGGDVGSEGSPSDRCGSTSTGGSQTAGGFGGNCNDPGPSSGSSLQGGNGAMGGGGGAGFFGGAGGNSGGSGSGGSSYINVNEATFSTLVLKNKPGVQVGDGFVSIELSVAPTPSPSRAPTPSPSTPPTPSPTYLSLCMLASTSPTSVNYQYGASAPEFVVPAGVPKGTIVRVRACGAQGGSGGGLGGFVKADLTAVAGDIITVLVGQMGTTAAIGGLSSSAVGGGGIGSYGAGGGGGYSSVSFQNNYVVIAGAGGGSSHSAGGGGGGPVALNGGADNCVPATYAGGGSQTKGGASAGCVNSCVESNPGILMQGGSSFCTSYAGAGGGGGYYGGASGGANGGGGGGSSFIHPSALNGTITNAQAVTQGDGYVSLELILGPTTAPSPAPSVAPTKSPTHPASQCMLTTTSNTSINFPYGASSLKFTVPKSAPPGTIATIMACGAQGGTSAPIYGARVGGLGGYVQASFAVSAEDNLDIIVGQQGPIAADTGSSGSALGGGGQGSIYGGGGGGYSAVFSQNYYLVIAGAGGGSCDSQGGGGGGLVAQKGGADSCSTYAGGGDQTQGGAASICTPNACQPSYPGSSMQGGSSDCMITSSGGGGGGYYGGASGGNTGGGGGGSSYIHPSALNGTTNNLPISQQYGDGYVSISLIYPSSNPPSPSPSSVSPTSAKPTLIPTSAMPTYTQLTIAPTPSPPMSTFSASQIVQGCSFASYSTNTLLYQQVLSDSIVKCMDLKLDALLNLQVSASAAVATSTTRALLTSAASSSSLLLTYQVRSVDALASSNLLGQNVANGDFSTYLSSFAHQYGALGLENATSSSVQIIAALSSPTTAPSAAATGGGGGASGRDQTQRSWGEHITLPPFSIQIQILVGFAVLAFAASLYVFFVRNNASFVHPIVRLGMLDIITSLPLSFTTAVANFVLVYEYLQSPHTLVLAYVVVLVRLAILLIAVYLVVKCLRKPIAGMLVAPLLHSSLLWVVVCLFIAVDPNLIRLFPFEKNDFTERSSGFPNMTIFRFAMSSQLLSTITFSAIAGWGLFASTSSASVISMCLSGASFCLALFTFLIKIIAEKIYLFDVEVISRRAEIDDTSLTSVSPPFRASTITNLVQDREEEIKELEQRLLKLIQEQQEASDSQQQTSALSERLAAQQQEMLEVQRKLAEVKAEKVRLEEERKTRIRIELESAAATATKASGIKQQKPFDAATKYADETLDVMKAQILRRGEKPLEFIPLDQLQVEIQKLISSMNSGMAFDEGRLDHLLACLDINPQYKKEKEEEMRAWREQIRGYSCECLEIMRAFVPSFISQASQSDLTSSSGAGYSVSLAKRLMTKRCLWLVRMSPEDIARIHEIALHQTYSWDGQQLDIVEMAAIYKALPAAFSSDPSGKKEQWRSRLETHLKGLLIDMQKGKLETRKKRNAAYQSQTPAFGDRDSLFIQEVVSSGGAFAPRSSFGDLQYSVHSRAQLDDLESKLSSSSSFAGGGGGGAAAAVAAGGQRERGDFIPPYSISMTSLRQSLSAAISSQQQQQQRTSEAQSTSGHVAMKVLSPLHSKRGQEEQEEEGEEQDV